MSSANSEMSVTEKKQQQRGRLQAAAIMAIVIAPMLIAYGVYFSGVGIPQTTVNKGELIDPPQSIKELSLQTLDNQDWNISSTQKRWRWVIPGYSTCNEQCQENLYLTRQVHIRLAEKSGRVERLYLLLDDQMESSTLAFIQQEHPHMPIVKTTQAAIDELFARTNLPANAIAEGRYFLMDQEGFIMMSYTPEHQGKELLDDIKRMLKYSYEE
jgi:cytochrome oxidase Cu insertion factor (SCO1/SenC/PrrC family)